MPTLTELKRAGYNQQRAVSHGAAITLVAGYGYYFAMFECATRVASILGERAMTDLGDGILEVIPHYRIPTEELHHSLTKLSKKFSVALVEYNITGKDGHFIGIWRINRAPNGDTSVEEEPAPAKPTPSYLDDY